MSVAMKRVSYAVLAVVVLISAAAAVVLNVPAAQDAAFKRAATAVMARAQ